MDKAWCNLSIVPVRANHSSKSEMVTQLIFGEIFNIIDKYEDWVLINTDYDNYDGWIDSKQMELINDDKITSVDLVNTVFSPIKNNQNQIINAVLGSSVYNVAGNNFTFNDNLFTIINKDLFANSKTDIIDIAKKYLNSPYLWGGKTPFGIDCSGFTQMVFKFINVKLPRDAHQQAVIGNTIDLLSEAKTGDLAFFENKEGKIVHVGIVIDNNKIIHSSGRVKVDSLDHEGIFSGDLNKYSHKLKMIKRIK